MKTTKFISSLMMFTAIAAMSFMSSCKKDKTDDTDDATLAGSEFSEQENIATDVDNMADASAMGTTSFRLGQPDAQNGILSNCATVTRDTVNHTITIDFGTVNCLCNDGRLRRGVIHIAWTGGGYFDVGSVKSVTFTDYYVNNKHVQGTRSVTNNGLNGAGHFTWTISASITVTKPAGGTHQWTTTRTREMIAGQSSLLNINDDIYSITGSATGTNSNGNSCTATITNPLIKNFTCPVGVRFITQGTIEIVPANHPTRTLDFGSGTCDDQATITKNGQTYTITLH